MAYEKQTWANGDVITETKLNHMEDGIANASTIFSIGMTYNEEYSADKTFSQIKEAYEQNYKLMITSITRGEDFFEVAIPLYSYTQEGEDQDEEFYFRGFFNKNDMVYRVDAWVYSDSLYFEFNQAIDYHPVYINMSITSNSSYEITGIYIELEDRDVTAQEYIEWLENEEPKLDLKVSVDDQWWQQEKRFLFAKSPTDFLDFYTYDDPHQYNGKKLEANEIVINSDGTLSQYSLLTYSPQE